MINIKVIHYQTGESQEKTLALETVLQGGGLIGRHPGCDLVLNSPEVSRVHARIIYKGGQYYFADLGSTDGSHVNDEEAKTNENFLLNPDDIIRIGEFILLVEEVELNGSSIVHQLQGSSDVDTSLTQTPQLQDGSDADAGLAQTPQLQDGSDADAGLAQTPQLQRPPVSKIDLPIQSVIFQAETLKAQGILQQGTSEFVFQGKLLVKGLSLSKRFHQKAMDLCQAELDAGKFSILVEHSDHFTIWQQAAECKLPAQSLEGRGGGL
jgi:pSer/pThr/pTyr-binding forkhead associated (FHA) protein